MFRFICLFLGLLSIAVPVHAVMLSPDGEGQVLIYPYYSTNDGTQTLLSVVNHDNTGKAVKVWFREARNGRVTASFNLYLAEFDVWTAALFTAADGTPAILTQDNSCTVPAIKTSTRLPQLPDGRRYLPLSNNDFSGARADGSTADIGRAATGYVEMIEMGSLVENSDSDIFSTHVSGVPVSCPSLVQAWAIDGYWTANATEDVLPPTGKLSGALTLLQIAEGSAHSVEATALERFSVVVQHTAPDAGIPDLGSAVTESARQKVESIVQTDDRMVRSFWPQQRAIDAVSAVLSQASVRIEYSVEPALAARTDWILTMPTRRFYADPALVATPVAPFKVLHGNPQACEPVDFTPYNRETGRPVGSVFINPNDPVSCLCDSAQALPVNRPLEEVPPAMCRRAPLSTTVRDLVFENGYLDLELFSSDIVRHQMRPAMEGEIYGGLPIIGFGMIRYRNHAARPDEIGIFSSTRPQQGETECFKDGIDCPGL